MQIGWGGIHTLWRRWRIERRHSEGPFVFAWIIIDGDGRGILRARLGQGHGYGWDFPMMVALVTGSPLCPSGLERGRT